MLGRTAARSRKFNRLTPWLGLFAVWVQLVASFGHIHPEDYQFLLRGRAASVLTAGDHPTPASTPDQNCLICDAIYLAANSTMPDVIAVPAPRVENLLAVLAIVTPLWLTLPRYLLFSTRGPPLA